MAQAQAIEMNLGWVPRSWRPVSRTVPESRVWDARGSAGLWHLAHMPK